MSWNRVRERSGSYPSRPMAFFTSDSISPGWRCCTTLGARPFGQEHVTDVLGDHRRSGLAGRTAEAPSSLSASACFSHSRSTAVVVGHHESRPVAERSEHRQPWARALVLDQFRLRFEMGLEPPQIGRHALRQLLYRVARADRGIGEQLDELEPPDPQFGLGHRLVELPVALEDATHDRGNQSTTLMCVVELPADEQAGERELAPSPATAGSRPHGLRRMQQQPAALPERTVSGDIAHRQAAVFAEADNHRAATGAPLAHFVIARLQHHRRAADLAGIDAEALALESALSTRQLSMRRSAPEIASPM